jgi:hypothetical protein
MEDWAALYKLSRLGFLALTLAGIAIYLYTGGRRDRLEEPALRMLQEDDE